VGLDRRGAERQLGGQFGVAQPLGQQPQHLQFPRGQIGQAGVRDDLAGLVRGEPFDQPAGDGRGEQRVAGANRAHRGDELLGRGVLEQEPARPGGQRGVDVLVEVEGGEDDDPAPGSRLGPEDAAGGLEPVHPRHPDVHEDNVGAVLKHRGDRFAAVGGLGRDRDPGLVQDEPEPAADQCLVIGDDHPQRSARRARLAHGGVTSAGVCAGSTGILAVTSHPPPDRGPAASSPPYSATRSRRPSRPIPAPRGTLAPPAPSASGAGTAAGIGRPPSATSTTSAAGS